jgi:hypothetical protein
MTLKYNLSEIVTLELIVMIEILFICDKVTRFLIKRKGYKLIQEYSSKPHVNYLNNLYQLRGYS